MHSVVHLRWGGRTGLVVPSHLGCRRPYRGNSTETIDTYSEGWCYEVESLSIPSWFESQRLHVSFLTIRRTSPENIQKSQASLMPSVSWRKASLLPREHVTDKGRGGRSCLWSTGLMLVSNIEDIIIPILNSLPTVALPTCLAQSSIQSGICLLGYSFIYLPRRQASSILG